MMRGRDIRVWILCHNGTKSRPFVLWCTVDNYWCAPLLVLNTNSAGSSHNNAYSTKKQVEGVNSSYTMPIE